MSKHIFAIFFTLLFLVCAAGFASAQVPSPGCLGSCPTSAPIRAAVNTTPGVSLSPTFAPCVTTVATRTVQVEKKKHHKKKKAGDGLVKNLLDLLIAMLNLFLQLLSGGSISLPVIPSPTSPTPTPAESLPTAVPTVGNLPSTSPSETPTSAPCPSPTEANFQTPASPTTSAPTTVPSAQNAGVFITRAELDRAKARKTAAAPFGAAFTNQTNRANAALSLSPEPFFMQRNDYLQNLAYGWCQDSNDGKDNSLGDATSKLESQSNTTRVLAMQFALTGDVRYGNKAVEFLKAWASNSTPVNMYDFYEDPNNFNARLRGMTPAFCSFRPWNMALDGIFQGYGLINFSDSYVLLRDNGYTFSSGDKTVITTYIRNLTEAVNSSFHAWTRWADAHSTSSSYVRYRADNHLSWGLASLLAASVALKDQQLADYAMSGGTWNDSRSGPYKNPSHVKSLIDLAVLSDGRIVDPVNFGRPESYTYFHLWALQLVSRIAEIHYGQDMWNYKGNDGAGLQKAYESAAVKVINKQFASDGWQYELVYGKWQTSQFDQARSAGTRPYYILQSIGPVTLLLGK